MVDGLRAVIGGDDLDAWWQTLFQVVKFRLHGGNRAARVRALAQHDEASRHFSLAIELGDTAPNFRAELDGGDIAHRHGHAAGSRTQRDGAEVVERLQIARGADHIFGLGQFDDRAARLLVRPPDRLHRLAMRDTVAGQLHRIEHHLILLRSEEHMSELQSLMRISYAVFCLKKKKNIKTYTHTR